MFYYNEAEKYRVDAIRFKDDAVCFNRNFRRLEKVVEDNKASIRELEKRNRNLNDALLSKDRVIRKLQHELSEKNLLTTAQKDQVNYLRRQVDELKLQK